MKKKEKVLSCEGCEAQCCRYVAIQIDTPTCKRDYDHIRWYLLHKDVSVFIDHARDWYVEFGAECEGLGVDSRCLIYNKRPRICQRHGETDHIECEYHSDDEPYVIKFSAASEFEKYLESKKIDWRWAR